MAISPRLITLNLASHTVGLAELRVRSHSGLVVYATFRPASELRAQIAVAVREMMSEMHIEHGFVDCAWPRNLFLRA